MTDERVPELVLQIKVYDDGSLQIAGALNPDGVPFALREIAKAMDEGGGTFLTTERREL